MITYFYITIIIIKNMLNYYLTYFNLKDFELLSKSKQKLVRRYLENLISDFNKYSDISTQITDIFSRDLDNYKSSLYIFNVSNIYYLYYLATDIIIGRDIYKKYEKINVSKFKDDILQFISNVEKDKSMSVILNEALRYYGKYDDSNNMLSIAKSLQIAQDDNLELKDLILIGKSIIFSNEFFNIISITDYNSTKEDSIFNNDISDTGFPELKFFSNNLNLLLDRMLLWGRSFIDIDSIIHKKFALYIYISNGFTYKFMLSFLLLLVEIDITNFFVKKGTI